jgi:glycosyltransferase involved in cell wall biosynthesis
MGDFGMYFENGNIEDLAQKLEDATHIDWQEKSKEALAIAQRFDIENIIKQWKELIE